MNLFDKLVTEALRNQPNWSTLRVVVEKELLHHDILRVLSHNNFLKDLTFMGGTCLRCCYGGERLSEDLDFTGGAEFTRENLSLMGAVLIDSLQQKYGLSVQVSEPIKDKENVDTWKVKVETRPEQKDMPAQRINIDICSVSSYERRPMMLLNPYKVDMGTSGLILQVQSREEIYVDKLIAFAFRPNRIKYRDLWDILWLHNQGFKPRLGLIAPKLKERNYEKDYFIDRFQERQRMLKENNEIASEFKKEMCRFLPIEKINSIIDQSHFWEVMVYLMQDLSEEIRKQ